MIPNLQIPHWDATHCDGIGGAPSSFPIISNNELDTHRVRVAEDLNMAIDDVFSTDHFRMFEFKVRNCPRGRSHDWTECPYAHPAEKARRRDPRKYHYAGTACPEFRKGYCNRGDSCHFAHGVFECWLHPSRYRTQLCKDAASCRRKVCFFAHGAEQLRALTHGSGDGSPVRQNGSLVSPPASVPSPTSVLDSSLLSESPPTSPGNIRYGCGVPFNAVSVCEIVSSMRNVQLDEVSSSGLTRGSQMGQPGRSLRPGILSLEEEPAMERVESGRDLRARMYAKLSRENSIVRSDVGLSAPIPDIGWVSELVK